MNKVRQYFSDYRLPTEYPLEATIRLYSRRVMVICIAVVLMMVAASLLSIVILAVKAGYGFVVMIVVVVMVLLYLAGGGPSGGVRSSVGTKPPSPNTIEPNLTKKGRPTDNRQAAQNEPIEPQTTQADSEMVLVPVSRAKRPRRKMLALRVDDPTKPPIVIEEDDE